MFIQIHDEKTAQERQGEKERGRRRSTELATEFLLERKHTFVHKTVQSNEQISWGRHTINRKLTCSNRVARGVPPHSRSDYTLLADKK